MPSPSKAVIKKQIERSRFSLVELAGLMENERSIG